MANRKIVELTDNMTTKDRVILFSAELVGTAILVFLGCLGCVVKIYDSATIPHEQISWTFGLAVMIAVQCFGHVSGSHINPIVTVAAAVLGNIPLIQVPIFFTGQLFGALTGFGLVKAICPANLIKSATNITVNGTVIVKEGLGVCSPGVNPRITPFQGLLVEFTISLILVLLCCGVWDSRNKNKHDSVPIKFGLTIAVLAMAGGPFTGANMNPVRSFAPALFNGDWENHWVYWIGPLSAGFFGALFYRVVFQKDQDVKENSVPEVIPLNETKG